MNEKFIKYMVMILGNALGSNGFRGDSASGFAETHDLSI